VKYLAKYFICNRNSVKFVKFNLSMKKIVYIFSVALLMLQACSTGGSSDGSSSTSTSGSLVGKWEVFQGGEFPLGTVITDSTPLVNFQFACPTLKDYWQFGSQGSFKAATYNTNCAEGGGIGTYIKTDNTLTIYQNNIVQVSMEIISLTNTSLKVKFPSPATGTPNKIMVESFKKIQ
jgi:hypothetical protein